MQVEEELRVRPEMRVSATPPLIPYVALFPIQGFDQFVAGVFTWIPNTGLWSIRRMASRGFPTQDFD